MTSVPQPRLGVPRLALAAVLAAGASLAGPAVGEARGASTPELIDRAVKAGRIDRARGSLYLAYALAPAAGKRRLPRAYRGSERWDGTLPLRRLRRELRQMAPGSERRRIQQVAAPSTPEAPPSSCGTSIIAMANAEETTNFFIEYNPPPILSAGLTIQHYADSLERAWGTEVASFGWAAPPLRPATGPASGRYHVRIDTMEDATLYGYVSNVGTHAGLVGDNTNTPWPDGDAYATCMVLNTNYNPTVFGSPQAALDATTAHEFNHSLQYGYGALNPDGETDESFIEGGATWMEDEVHDASNDNYHYLWPDFRDSMGDYQDNIPAGQPYNPYSYWITFRGLTERYGAGVAGGAEQVMQELWEQTSRAPIGGSVQMSALQAGLALKGTTLPDAFHAYAIAAKLMKPCGGGYAYPYCFEEAAAYLAGARDPDPPARFDGTISAPGSGVNSSVEDNYGLAWIALPVGTTYSLTLSNTSSGGNLRGSAVCDTGSALTIASLPQVVAAAQASMLPQFDATGCASAAAVITNEAQTASNPPVSVSRSYSLGAGPPAAVARLQVGRGGPGSGAVTSNPPGIDCGADCSEAYAPGTNVTLTATPASGSRFLGWSGKCSGTGACVLRMESNEGITASFGPLLDTTAPVVRLLAGRLARIATALRRRVRATVSCSEPCSIRLESVVDRRTARGLGLRPRARRMVIGRITGRLLRPGRRRLTVSFTQRARRGLRRARRVRVTLRATVRDSAGNATTVQRRLTLRR